MIKLIFRLSQSTMRKLRKAIILNRYNDFTIAEYFRKQGARIGEGNRIEVRNLGPEPYLVEIGNHCTIGPGVTFECHDGATWIFTEKYPSLQKFGYIRVLDNCFIGVRSIILGNVTIGPNSIVGAGAVVTKDVPPNSVAAGNPAMVVKTVEEYGKKALLTWQKQRPPGYFDALQDGEKYSPAYIQQQKIKELGKLKEHLINVCWNETRKKDACIAKNEEKVQ